MYRVTDWNFNRKGGIHLSFFCPSGQECRGIRKEPLQKYDVIAMITF